MQKPQSGLSDMCSKHNMPTSPNSFGIGICKMCEKEEMAGRAEAHSTNNIEKYHKQLALPRRLKNLSFEGYRPGNKDAAKALKACERFVAEFPDTGGLVLIGGVGTGKTHLAAAICIKICDMGYSSRLVTVPEIIREVRATWSDKNEKTEAEIIKENSNCGLLVIDEIGSQYGSDSEKIIISEIINRRYNNCLPSIIIGNVTISEAIDYLGLRVLDRIKDNGEMIVFNWPSYRQTKSAENG